MQKGISRSRQSQHLAVTVLLIKAIINFRSQFATEFMKQNMKFSLKLMFHTAAIKNFCLIITFKDGKSAEEEEDEKKKY